MKGNKPSLLGPQKPPAALSNPPHSVHIGKLLRVTGWDLRFVRHASQQRRSPGEMEVSELNGSAHVLDQRGVKGLLRARPSDARKNCSPPRESLVPRFFFEDGILRIGGRLHFADLSRKQIQPILLHGSQHFTALLIMQTHVRLNHLGFRIVLLEFREEF